MSEYQYYEFAALDRRLTADEITQLRAISSRADISAIHFKNEYSYSGLKADPLRLLERYFDVYVYLASWGERTFALRLPGDIQDYAHLLPFCARDIVTLKQAGTSTVLIFQRTSEDYSDWIDGTAWMSMLASVRADILSGDLRALYVGWLASVDEDIDKLETEPPVPPGLRALPPAIIALADFLCVDEWVLAAGAEASDNQPALAGDLDSWIAALSADEKDALLARVVRGEHAQVAAGLATAFQRELRATQPRVETPRRTVGVVLDRAEVFLSEHLRAAELAEEQARLDKLAAFEAARQLRLDKLAGRVDEAWAEVTRLAAPSTPKGYDQAVALLGDLRALAIREGREIQFGLRLDALCDAHRRKVGLLARIDTAKLRD